MWRRAAWHGYRLFQRNCCLYICHCASPQTSYSFVGFRSKKFSTVSNQEISRLFATHIISRWGWYLWLTHGRDFRVSARLACLGGETYGRRLKHAATDGLYPLTYTNKEKCEKYFSIQWSLTSKEGCSLEGSQTSPIFPTDKSVKYCWNGSDRGKPKETGLKWKWTKIAVTLS